ncbi:hypothetical protein P167DRAFT_216296 [Morchella conica CCBAS932]|uniref:Uncharacterized protein n=1 Tax=Morchella conica CCBAS932 TaxID=1392247 RepID=A0A3N4KLX6_9PEZI|nr:hypothetical protein P167DRAFT_216296 [Morchella conica CCBAS932]
MGQQRFSGGGILWRIRTYICVLFVPKSLRFARSIWVFENAYGKYFLRGLLSFIRLHRSRSCLGVAPSGPVLPLSSAGRFRVLTRRNTSPLRALVSMSSPLRCYARQREFPETTKDYGARRHRGWVCQLQRNFFCMGIRENSTVGLGVSTIMGVDLPISID